jgi:signal transduction histidine kinase
MKTDFIAIASHELRTPLGLVLGYASLLQEETNKENAELAEMVVNSAMRMRALIDDMASLHMLQIGSSELELDSHELQSIMSQAVDEVHSLVEAKGQTMRVDMPERPIICRLDAAKLTLALANLLNNAMRFTPDQGEITLRLGQHGKEALIEVSDSGVGIPSDQIERIFEAFYQVEDHMTRRHGGLGLGLAIVAAIVEAHQGRVWAESEGEDQGAKITLAIPLE